MKYHIILLVSNSIWSLKTMYKLQIKSLILIHFYFQLLQLEKEYIERPNFLLKNVMVYGKSTTCNY